MAKTTSMYVTAWLHDHATCVAISGPDFKARRGTPVKFTHYIHDGRIPVVRPVSWEDKFDGIALEGKEKK